MIKWLKWIGVLAVVILGIAAVTGVALAQGPVDEDGDGQCDICGQEAGQGWMHGWRYHQNGQQTGRGPYGDAQNCPHFVDENNDGVCDNFIDEDGDGVCDNHAGRGQGQGSNFVDEDGDGVCDNFVDEDGDGVCDLRNQAGQPGSGGRGMMGGRGMYGRGANGQQNGN